jgi:hypothetical protein
MKVLARLFRRETASEALMPNPQRSSAPATPVAKTAPVPPPLPRRSPAPPAAAPALAVESDELENSLDQAFDQMVDPARPAAGGARPSPASTASDMAAVHSTYAELAVEYCAPVRNIMLEVRWGEPPMLWLEHVRAALVALRAMAAKVELTALVEALDGFKTAVSTALDSGEGMVRAERRDKLLAAYAPLCACLPRAFDLEGERDRREPVILRALLLLVPDLSPLAVDKFFSAGLNRLELIAKARPEEMAVVTGLEPSLAQQVVERVRAERALAAGDAGQERRHLASLTAQLGEEHRALERASAGWSAQSQTDKRRCRQQRQESWLRIKISLARLGEVDRIDRLERLPFARKLEALEKLIGGGAHG